MSVPEVYTLTAGKSVLQFSTTGEFSFLLDGKHAWRSQGPLCIMHYYDRQHPRAQEVVVPWNDAYSFGTAGTPSLSATCNMEISHLDERELQLLVSFQPLQITCRIHIILREDGSGFSVQLNEDDVVEGYPLLYRLLGIEVLPEFGAARTGESGYLTLPNWFGCQTFFNKSYPRETWQTIYSSNDQWEHVCNMPVYGITREQGTLCGLVAKGDFDAQLVCRVHWEAAQANSVHPYLVYRWQQQDDILPGAREMRYAFAPPNYAFGEGYVFCGKTYRKFLIEERGLQTWEEKRQLRPEATDYLDRFFLKIFMAYKDPQPDGKGEYHVTCSFADAQQILEQCQARGMKKLTAILVGWGQDGHDGMPPTRFPVDERLGGETGMKQLLAWCKEHDVLLGVHDSYGGSYSCSPEHDINNLIRHQTGEYWQSIIWSGGQCHIVCPTVFMEKHVLRDIPAVAKLGLHGHHHIDAVGSFQTCYSPLHPLERRADFIATVREMFKVAIKYMGSVSTEMPFGPYFDVVDGFFHSYVHPSPWHLASQVGRWFYDRTVPLLTIALHGSNNCGQSMGYDNRYLTELLDLGLTPQYEVAKVASPTFGIPLYEKAADRLAEVYQFCYGEDGLITRLNYLTIEGRWELQPGVNKTLYSDGTSIVANMNDEACQDIPAKSFVVREGDNCPVE